MKNFQLAKYSTIFEDTFDFLCKQKGLEIRWELSKEVDTLKTDPERFKEIVSNLLQNAVKYTDRGVISVRLTWSTSQAVALEVCDSGIGIAHHHLLNIFDPFMQAHKTSSENSRGGIGLGLSIVKKHVEQMHGTITVESELGKGTTFKMILPRVYEVRPSARRRLRNLIKLPMPRMRENAVSFAASSTEKVGEATKINRAVG